MASGIAEHHEARRREVRYLQKAWVQQKNTGSSRDQEWSYPVFLFVSQSCFLPNDKKEIEKKLVNVVILQVSTFSVSVFTFMIRLTTLDLKLTFDISTLEQTFGTFDWAVYFTPRPL